MSLGSEIRERREARELRLWEVAPKASMDSALLSRIERGERLPTKTQTAVLAEYFGADAAKWEGVRMAEKFLNDNRDNPAAAALALTHLQENASDHFVNRKGTAVNYRTKPVQKSKKKT